MTNSKVLAAFMAGAALFAASGLAQAAKGSPAAKARRAAKKDVIKPADAMKWEDAPVKGAHVVKLKGDWLKGGPYEVLVKFDAGLTNPLHHHSQDLKIVVVS